MNVITVTDIEKESYEWHIVWEFLKIGMNEYDLFMKERL